MKKIPLLLALIIFIAAVLTFKHPKLPGVTPQPSPSPSPRADVFSGVSYQAVDPQKFTVSVLKDNLAGPTRLKITSDGQWLLVTQIQGDILAFHKEGDNWNQNSQVLTRIETKAPGFPPDEFGLVGLVFSADFTHTHKVFALYNYQESESKYFNRISAFTLTENDNKLSASTPEMIFQAVTPGNVSHQITDGLSIMHQGKPHLVFLIGEGFKGKLAQDESAEAGKLMMIQEDGTYPVGTRPYPNRPKIEALGIRNAYVIAENPFDPYKRWLIGDTGPDHFDRLIYTRTESTASAQLKPVNFNWNGEELSLKKPLKDPNFARVSDMGIFRFPDTRTFTGLTFHPGRGSIPTSTPKSQSVLVTLFGKTGSTDNEPGKAIWLGKLTNLTGQPRISFQQLIIRNPAAAGKVGNPLGLEVDPQTGDFFFADIMEGRIYQVQEKKQ